MKYVIIRIYEYTREYTRVFIEFISWAPVMSDGDCGAYDDGASYYFSYYGRSGFFRH